MKTINTSYIIRFPRKILNLFPVILRGGIRIYMQNIVVSSRHDV